jgi:hypothetical protein
MLEILITHMENITAPVKALLRTDLLFKTSPNSEKPILISPFRVGLD